MLSESAKTDREYRKKALRFFQSVYTWALNVEDTEAVEPGHYRGHRNTQFKGYAFEIGRDLMRGHEQMALVLAYRGKMKGNAAAMAHQSKSGVPVMVLSVLRNPYELDGVATQISNRKNEIVHEYVHYMDALRGDVQGSAGLADAGDMQAHYNSPAEYNAYYQEAARLTDSLLVKLGEYGKTDKYFGSFAEFEKFFMGNVDKEFAANMTRKTRNRLRKRIYGMWELLNKEYTDMRAKHESKTERGKRDGTGPHKDSAMGKTGKRKKRGEPCPADKRDDSENGDEDKDKTEALLRRLDLLLKSENRRGL